MQIQTQITKELTGILKNKSGKDPDEARLEYIMDKYASTHQLILLASLAGNFALHLKTTLTKKGIPLNAVFITTAANVYRDKPWMEHDIQQFKDASFTITRTDFASLSIKACQELLNQNQILIIGGGNVFYLLQILQQKSLIKLIHQRVNQGMVYVGSSAGAAIAGPDISPASFLDDPSKAPLLKSTQGLNLYPKTILPHYGNPKYDHLYQQTLDKYQSLYKLQLLTDTQAIQIIDEKIELIEI